MTPILPYGFRIVGPIWSDRRWVNARVAFAGYAGWSPGQLEDEMKRKAWVTHPASLEEEGLEGNWTKDFTEVAKENVTPSYVQIDGFMEMTCFMPDGVDRIKDAPVFTGSLGYRWTDGLTYELSFLRVSGKDDLLTGMADLVIAEIDLPSDGAGAGDRDAQAPGGHYSPLSECSRAKRDWALRRIGALIAPKPL